jgi:hypothetical protein
LLLYLVAANPPLFKLRFGPKVWAEKRAKADKAYAAERAMLDASYQRDSSLPDTSVMAQIWDKITRVNEQTKVVSQQLTEAAEPFKCHPTA